MVEFLKERDLPYGCGWYTFTLAIQWERGGERGKGRERGRGRGEKGEGEERGERKGKEEVREESVMLMTYLPNLRV